MILSLMTPRFSVSVSVYGASLSLVDRLVTGGQCDYVVSLGSCGCALTTQSTAQNQPELLSTDTVDDEVGRGTENFEHVTEFHE